MTTSLAYSYSDEDVLRDESETLRIDTTQDDDDSGWWELITSQLRRIAALEEDWDSYGGERMAISTASECVILLAHLGTQFQAPTISPRSTGGLLLDWESPDHEVSIEVEPNRTLSLLIMQQNGDIETEVIGLTLGRLLQDYSQPLKRCLPAVT